MLLVLVPFTNFLPASHIPPSSSYKPPSLTPSPALLLSAGGHFLFWNISFSNIGIIIWKAYCVIALGSLL